MRYGPLTLIGLLPCLAPAAWAAAPPSPAGGAGNRATVEEPAAQPPGDDEDPAGGGEAGAPPPDEEAPAAIRESGSETDAGGFLPRAFRAVRRQLRFRSPEDWSLRFDLQTGVVGRTHPLPRNSFRSWRVELVRRTDGSAVWHHTYRFPSYGAGVQFADFGGAPTDRGRPVSAYWFIQTPIAPPVAAVDVLSSIGMGVTHGWNTPAFEAFPFERHPTTRFTSYVDLGFLARRRLSDRFDLLAGFSLNHFSNGGVGSPNRGLTVTAPRFAIQRSLGVRGPPPRREDRPPFVDRWETRLDGGLAVRGVGFFWRGDRFGPRGSVRVAALKGSIWRRFHRIGQVGGGVEGALETARPRGTARTPDADLDGGGSIAFYTGYEQIAGPFAIYLHFGTHLARTRTDERPAPVLPGRDDHALRRALVHRRELPFHEPGQGLQPRLHRLALRVPDRPPAVAVAPPGAGAVERRGFPAGGSVGRPAHGIRRPVRVRCWSAMRRGGARTEGPSRPRRGRERR